jgi:putative phosphoesterase
MFIHLGDGMLEVLDLTHEYTEQNTPLKFAFVKGNCDYLDYQEECVVEVAGHRIFCTHGHNYDVHWGLDGIIERARTMNCKIVLFGHTHIYRTECIDGMYIMNPGSLDRPRGKNRATYGTITIAEDGTVSMNIVAYKQDKGDGAASCLTESSGSQESV